MHWRAARQTDSKPTAAETRAVAAEARTLIRPTQRTMRRMKMRMRMEGLGQWRGTETELATNDRRDRRFAESTCDARRENQTTWSQTI